MAQITAIPVCYNVACMSKQVVSTAAATAAISAATSPPAPHLPTPVVVVDSAASSSPVPQTKSLNLKVSRETIGASTLEDQQHIASPTIFTTRDNQPIGTLEAVVVWVHRYRLQRGVAIPVTPSTTLRNFLDVGIGLYLQRMAPRLRQPGDAPGTSTDGSGGYGIGGGYGPIRTAKTEQLDRATTVEPQVAAATISMPTRWQDIPGGFQACAQTVRSRYCSVFR